MLHVHFLLKLVTNCWALNLLLLLVDKNSLKALTCVNRSDAPSFIFMPGLGAGGVCSVLYVRNKRPWFSRPSLAVRVAAPMEPWEALGGIRFIVPSVNGRKSHWLQQEKCDECALCGQMNIFTSSQWNHVLRRWDLYHWMAVLEL